MTKFDQMCPPAMISNNLAFWKVSSSPKLSRWVQLEVVRPKVFGFWCFWCLWFKMRFNKTLQYFRWRLPDRLTFTWKLAVMWFWGDQLLCLSFKKIICKQWKESPALQFTRVWWWSPWILRVILGFLICRDTCHLSQIVQIPQFGEYVTVGGERQIDGN